MSHIVESCPLTKLNGRLSRLHSADEDAVSWLTNYGKWHAYEKKKKIFKIEVLPRQPVGTPIFEPWKRFKIWGKRPSIIRRLAMGLDWRERHYVLSVSISSSICSSVRSFVRHVTYKYDILNEWTNFDARNAEAVHGAKAWNDRFWGQEVVIGQGHTMLK